MSDNLTYGDIPPQVQQYLARPGVNKQKALEWFSLGISEPQTYNQAKLLAEAVGNSPEQAKVVAGQWQLESGGGASVGANYNYFGIKSHDKATRDKLSARGIAVAAGANTETGEVVGGKKIKQQSSFMEFPSSFDAFQAHRVFLETNPRYQGALAAETAKDFALGLEEAGYATAPNYGTTLYNNYVAPKEKRPTSGDVRPSSLGKTKSKLGTSLPEQQPIVLPSMPTKSPELITNTLGVRPEISTSPSQASYMPENSAPIVMPESQAMKLTTPAGWFGSGKTIFANGGTLTLPTQSHYNKYSTMEYAKGGGIHINPAHKGDFTAKANAAGMGVQEFASKVLGAPEGQYDPSTRQQANFAKNAASWNHAMGGNMYANGGSFNNKGFRALPTNVQNKIKSNSFADGGPMGQLTEFNGGGTHEENPLGGIPQGTAPDGAANLVESGETKLNAENYIFSDQIKITKEIAKEFNLPEKLVGRTYAEASKKVNYSDSRREPGYDTIQDNSSKKNLDTLMQGQELQKQMEVQKKLGEIQSLDPNALAQIAQSYQPQGMPPQGGAPQGMEEMPQGQPSQEEMMMMQQGQGQSQEQMDPAMMQQMMAQQGGQPMAYGGPMSYKCGGNMYDFGGTMRTVGAAAYGIGEGLLDTATMGLTDQFTDKGYDALSGIGNASKKDLEAGKSARGFGNTAGAIGGAIINPATVGSAVSEGSEGLAAGLSNISGTNEKFDNIANSAGQLGSVVGGFIGGNPTEATGAMAGSQGANALMQFGSKAGNISNLMEGASAGFANGGHLYPTNYPTYKDNAGPMGQPLTNMYVNGGYKEEDIYSPDPNSIVTDDTLAQESYDAKSYLAGLPNPDGSYSPISGFKTEQSAIDMPSGYTENLGTYAASMAPIIYNAYQGFLAKKAPLPSIESMTASYDPYRQDIAPQLTAADRALASSQRAAKDVASGGGSYMANMQNSANQYRDYINEVTAGRENAYGLAKQEADKYRNKNKVDATLARYQLEAQMQAARQEHQKEALLGIKGLTEAQKQNALASDYNTLAGEGNYSYVYTPYLKSLQEKRNKKKEDNKTR